MDWTMGLADPKLGLLISSATQILGTGSVSLFNDMTRDHDQGEIVHAKTGLGRIGGGGGRARRQGRNKRNIRPLSYLSVPASLTALSSYISIRQ